MISTFSKNIAPVVQAEIDLARKLQINGHSADAFKHLENAHVLGQDATWWHVKVHVLMLMWAVRQKNGKEFMGQIFRIAGAATKTALGLVPAGNTGGTSISPFKTLPIKPEHQTAIQKARRSL